MLTALGTGVLPEGRHTACGNDATVSDLKHKCRSDGFVVGGAVDRVRPACTDLLPAGRFGREPAGRAATNPMGVGVRVDPKGER